MKRKTAFEGVRVIEFTHHVLGPTCTKFLADFGAEVIKIESSTAFDDCRAYIPYRNGVSEANRSCCFAWINTGKRSVTLNLKTQPGKEIAKKLVSQADIVVENFSPGAMERLGLSYEELKQVNPEIIFFSGSGLGQSGPSRLLPLLGVFVQAGAGFHTLFGMPNREPATFTVPYPDYLGAYFGVIAIIGSLLYRQRTGKGQYIDLSMLEVSIPLIGPAILDYLVNGRESVPMGNRMPYAAPHGVYRCQGDDRWCAISVFNDEEWAGFVRSIGCPSWTSDTRFATVLGRKQNEEELDRDIEEWTLNHTAEEVVTLLQANGVAAAVVQNAKDVVEDPQLNYRHHIVAVEGHQELGTHYSQAPSFILSKTPAKLRSSPCLGQDNEYVITQMLGMSDDQFVELVNSGVLD